MRSKNSSKTIYALVKNQPKLSEEKKYLKIALFFLKYFDTGVCLGLHLMSLTFYDSEKNVR